MQGVKILGTGVYTPKNVIDNDRMSQIVETNDEWISTRTGIRRRHLSNGEPTWYMGLEAAKAALRAANTDPSEIGLIIDTSVTPDYNTPSMACIIQGQLGAVGSIAMDVSAACAGFVYGLDMAKRYLQTDSGIKKALIITNETLSKITDYTDRTTCILFGDAAAAAVVEAAPDTLYSSFIGADGTGAKFLFSKCLTGKNPFVDGEFSFDDPMPAAEHGYFVQDGREVYKFATRTLPIAAEEACKRAGITINDVDIFIPHQANYRIIETAAKNLGVPMDKFYLNLAEYGNTSSASIPLALHEAVETGALKRGDRVCLVGFGAGLTYGAVILKF